MVKCNHCGRPLDNIKFWVTVREENEPETDPRKMIPFPLCTKCVREVMRAVYPKAFKGLD